MTTEKKEVTGLALLRKPFEKHQISKLPKPYKKDSPKGDCPECGKYHGLPAMHLDYVGHAALTDRLLDVDEKWEWTPLAFDADGLPKFDKNGGLWIKLTVCGVTRFGYGNTEKDSENGDAEKEIIGDALRNAAMRFGAALDLWHKGDLKPPEQKPPKNPAEFVVKIGKQYKGMMLKDMKDFEIDGYAKWLSAEQKKANKKPTAAEQEFFDNASAYLENIGFYDKSKAGEGASATNYAL